MGLEEGPAANKARAEMLRKNQLRLWDGKIEFRANLMDDMVHNKYGEMVIKITIPFDEVESAIEMRRLLGLPVKVSFELWKPFGEFIRTGEMPDPNAEVANG